MDSLKVLWATVNVGARNVLFRTDQPVSQLLINQKIQDSIDRHRGHRFFALRIAYLEQSISGYGF
jgi:hypothetical protein